MLSYLGFGMALVLAIGIQFVVRGMEGVQAESMINFLSGQQGLIDIFHAIFPNLVFLAKGVSHGSFIYILFYYGTTVLIFAVFLLIAQKLYLHRNTVNYRLQKFIEQSGLDIRDYHNAQLLYFCTLIKENAIR